MKFNTPFTRPLPLFSLFYTCSKLTVTRKRRKLENPLSTVVYCHRDTRDIFNNWLELEHVRTRQYGKFDSYTTNNGGKAFFFSGLSAREREEINEHSFLFIFIRYEKIHCCVIDSVFRFINSWDLLLGGRRARMKWDRKAM